MRELTCHAPTRYIATPEYLERAVHIAAAVSTPLHIIGLFIILRKTPKAMSSVKWYFLNLHFWILICDHFISTLSIPFLLFPTLSGFSLGILPKLGVPDVLIVVLVLLSCAYVLISILAVFENRFHIVCTYSWKVYWEKIRTIWLLFHYVFAIIAFIPFWFYIPDQEAAKERVLETLPCLPDYIENGPIFVLTESYTYHLTTLTSFMLVGVLETVIFISFLIWNVIQQVRSKKMSKKTLNLQMKFLFAVLIQMLVPFFTLVLPLSIPAFAAIYNFYDQAFMNLSVVLEATHGLSSTSVMIFVHYPYRCAFLALFRRRPKSSDEDSKVVFRPNRNVSVMPS